MNRPGTWPAWQPQPGTEDPGRGGMSQLAAYDAGLTDDPGCWTQKIEVYWDARLDPRSPEYSPEFVAQVEWEQPSPAEEQAMAESPEPEPGPQPGPDPDAEPELPF